MSKVTFQHLSSAKSQNPHTIPFPQVTWELKLPGLSCSLCSLDFQMADLLELCFLTSEPGGRQKRGGDRETVFLCHFVGLQRAGSCRGGEEGAWFCVNDLGFFFFNFILLYNTVLVLPYIDMNPPWVYMSSQSWTPSHLPPHTISLGHPSAPAPSILYPALNLDWQFVSYMILYTFQCHSPKSSHPLPLPQSPKDCSIHLCLFCCLAHRVIITIFLNSIYMC